jgi:hypothetical protein
MKISHLIKVLGKSIYKEFDCDIDSSFLSELGFNHNQSIIRNNKKINVQFLLSSIITVKIKSKNGKDYYIFYPIETSRNEFPITKREQLLKLIDIYVDKE